MSNITTRAKALADRLCAEHGGSAVIVREEGGTEPQNPWDDPGEPVEVEYPVEFVETGYQVGTHDADLVQTGDLLGVMAVPMAITPQPLDVMRVHDRDFILIDLKPLATRSDMVACYGFQARA